MKKSILKSLQPRTKTLFRFNNSEKDAQSIRYNFPTTTTDPTTTTSTTVTWLR